MSAELTLIDFHSDRIVYVEMDGFVYVPAKPICDNLALDWSTQHRKLTSGERPWSIRHMTMVGASADGKDREMVCLPLHLLPAWLFTVSPAKVRADLRDKLIVYQRECADVLWRHFSGQHSAREEAMADELAHIRRCGERLRAHVLADRALWNKIARYWDLGLSVYDIARLLRRPYAEIVAHHDEMKRCGVIASKLGLDGPWADASGILPSHAQDDRTSLA